MLCDTARALAAIRRLGDLPAEDRADLNAHLEGCPACAAWLTAEADFDARLTRMMADVVVPPGLKQDVAVAALFAGRRHRRLRRVGLFATASVLIAAGGLAWWSAAPVPRAIDLPRFAGEIETALTNPQADAERWLAKQGIAFRPEVPLDLAKIVAHGTATLDGREMPVLTFRNPTTGAFARVFVLPEGRYSLDTAPSEPISTVTLGYQFQVLRDRENPKRAYLVMYSGNGLDEFKPALQGA